MFYVQGALLETRLMAKLDDLRQDMNDGLADTRKNGAVLRTMLTYLNIHHKEVNLEVAARISATHYFKEYFEALYDAEGEVRIDILCLGRYEPWQTQRFFRKWCGNARPHPIVKNPGLSDFVMLAECSVWRAFIVAESSMQANGRDIEKAVRRAAWLRECLALNAKPYCVIPCIIALDWIKNEEHAIDTLREAECQGVACLSGRYEYAMEIDSLQLTPATHFTPNVFKCSQGVLRPRAAAASPEPKKEIVNRDTLEQALLQQVGQHRFCERLSLEQQHCLVKVGLGDNAAQQAIHAQDWSQSFTFASQALIRIMERKN